MTFKGTESNLNGSEDFKEGTGVLIVPLKFKCGMQLGGGRKIFQCKNKILSSPVILRVFLES